MKKYPNSGVFAGILFLILSLGACSKESTLSLSGVISKSLVPVVSASDLSKDDKSYFRNIIIEVANKNIPAVVHIEVTQRQEVTNTLVPFETDPFFRHFFNFPKAPKKFKRELKGIGTGMIMNDKGYILTNNHVVEGATQIQVSLSNESQYEAKVIGTDPKTDLAVIKINAKEKLPYVAFGDSDKVQVGEWVVAIGQPRGLTESVTQGIISAKHRQGITDPSNYQDFLQTDAAINPGNSGGPLINLDGQVIGVNSVIASQSGGFEGIGFAIPSNMAIYISNELIEHGKVRRGWLGITIQDVAFDKMKALKLSSTKGAVVMDVLKEGPADKAGVKKNDVIVFFNGKEIKDSGELRNLVASTAIGKEASLGILRDGRKLTLSARIGNLENAAKMITASVKDRLGVEFRPVTEKEMSRYNLEQDQGVAIKWLDANGLLAKAGFEVDDIILQIDDQPIDGVEKIISVVSVLKPGQQITVLVLDHRSGQTGYIQVAVK
ncbi:MAG TPA: Do family serine endopeptidase [Desulfomonilia bacterium]|nr:Do family serine endopeptidase [Desulfomonilia bacterium]